MESALSTKNLNQVLQSLRNSRTYTSKCKKCQQPIIIEQLRFCSDNFLPFYCKKHAELALSLRAEDMRISCAANITKLLLQKGVPPRYLECSFDSFLCPPGRKAALQATKQVAVSNSSTGVFLTGPNGTGKTHLATAILRESLLNAQQNCRWIKLPNLLFEVKQAFKSSFHDSEQVLVQRFLDFDLLILDELGVSKITPWALQTLYLIIDGRSSNFKKTVFTSNLTLQDIEDNLDARFASRIVEMCKIVKVDGEDYRLLTKTNKLKAGSK